MRRSHLWSSPGFAICAVGAAAFLAFAPRDAGAGSATVELRSTPPVPSIVELPVGGVLTWHDDDAVRHRVRSVGHDEEFDSGELEPGGTYTHAFSRPGAYVYYDRRWETDAKRFGAVVVGAPAGAPAEPPADPPAQPPPASSAPPASAPPTIVEVRDFAFAPATVTVTVGATVTFHNAGASAHAATARDGSFDVTLDRGASASVTLARVGTYAFYCRFHPSMVGSITVVAGTGPVAGGASPPAAPGVVTTRSTPVQAPSVAPPPRSVRKLGVAATVRDFRFAPAVVHVRAGQTVYWTNRGVASHSVSALNGSFDSGILDPGKTWKHVFRRKGVYRLVCGLHPQMRATVVVRPLPGVVKRHPRARPAKRTGTRSRAKS